MGGLATALNTGKTSLSTTQKVIEISGNNIANVNTPGYSRQKASLTTYPSLNFGGFVIGQGVLVGTIEREHDAFLTSEIRQKNAAYGEEDAKTLPLTELERVFNISDGGLGTEIDNFFDAWQELASNPGGQTERDMVLQQGNLLSDAFQSTIDDLAAVQENIDETLLSKLDGINDNLQRVADLNNRIATIESVGQSANTFRDERDLLLADLSKAIGAQSIENKEGVVSLQLPSGEPLVQNGKAMSLEGSIVAGELRLNVVIDSIARPVDTSRLGGELKGMLEIRDQFIPELKGKVDKLAYDLITAVNTAHQAGSDLNGNTGELFFNAPPPPPPPAEIWEGAAYAMSIVLTTPDQVAAGTSLVPGDPAPPGDNTIAQAIAGIGTAKVVDGTDTLVGSYSRICARVGIEAGQNQLARNANEDTMTQLQNLRDSVAGVSLEEEMINLIQYQKGFEASAKLLATVDEMMDTLLSIKR
jgi:flagellar hook-associated protein 1 FlgK